MNLNEIFDNWNELKKKINSERIFYVKEGYIYFVSVGQNIGYESYGKDKYFLRPVLVLKKLSKYSFIGIPLTSKEKKGSHYYSFIYKSDKKSYAMLNQIRTFDTKRVRYISGKINRVDFLNIKEKIMHIINITPQKEGCMVNDQQNISSIISLNKDKVNTNKVFIIAEAGVNHNGSIDLAKKLIDVAVEAGANAVKFQTFKAKNLVSKDAQKAQYQKENMQDDSDSQYEMLKKLELDIDTHKELMAYCKEKNIMFLSTPFDSDSIKLLDELGLEIFKIPSGEITNLPYLQEIGALGKKVILSTGMADIGEIEDALDVLVQAGTKKEDITVLHANTMYPTPMEDVNLKAMVTIGKTFDVKYGYSDHTLGIEVPIAAVAMGASVIEKHFTLDKNMPGPDHKASLEPEELKAMVSAIRNIEVALGSSIKKPSKSELPNKEVARKSIVAKKDIKKGEKFTKENLTIKRPGNGISPMRWDELIGKVAQRDYKEDELI